MNAKNHIGGAEADLCIGMSSHVVKELFDLLPGVLSMSSLLSGNVGLCHKYCRVDSPCIVQEATDDLLGAFLTGVVKERTVISRRRCLSILAVRDGIGQEETMLWFVRRGVSITSELFHDAFEHGKVNVSIVVIPFQLDATI